MSINLTTDAPPPVKLLLNSDHATTYTYPNESTDYYINFNRIHRPDKYDIYVSLESCVIPVSMYSISQHRQTNKIDIKETDDDGSNPETAVVTLNEGNYSADDLATHIATQLNSASLKNLVYTVTYDDILNKYKIYIDQKKAYFLFNTGVSSSNLHKIIGYNKDDVEITTSESVTTNCLDMYGGLHNIYVFSDLVDHHTISSSTGDQNNILARIPINVDAGGVLVYDAFHRKVNKISGASGINGIHLRLEDEFGKYLKLNGLHWSCEIILSFHLRKPMIYMTSRKDMSGVYAVGDIIPKRERPQLIHREPPRRNKQEKNENKK